MRHNSSSSYCFRTETITTYLFNIVATGRPMPDLIPEYDTVEMEDYDEPGNETYERVEDVLRNFEHDSHGIGKEVWSISYI